MIKNVKSFSFTKIVGILSGLLLLCLSAGLFVMSFTEKNISNTNYVLNDISEKTRFENLLTEQEIPFEKISGNVYSVFVNKKVLQKGVKKVSTFNTQ